MKTITKIEQLRKNLKKIKKEGKRIGFVPTMGYLHEGHLSLIKQARKETGFVVISIFVNPTQFGPKEDYRKYPHDLNRDKRLAKMAGVDVVFAPSVSEIYPPSYSTPLEMNPVRDKNLSNGVNENLSKSSGNTPARRIAKKKRSLSLTGSTYVEVEGISDILCGASRRGHFRGVATIVTKLFNIVQPDIAYFGQKDFQQAVIIKKMVKGLNMELKIKILPTVRERDGLAMSSRNTYLSPQERTDATVLYQSLQQARKMVKSNIKDPKLIKSKLKELIGKKKSAKVDYIAIVDPESLEEVKEITRSVAILLAVWIGKTRLIDNMFIRG